MNFITEFMMAFLCWDMLRISMSSSVGILAMISLIAFFLFLDVDSGIAIFLVFRFAFSIMLEVNKLSKLRLVGPLFVEFFLNLIDLFELRLGVLLRFDHH